MIGFSNRDILIGIAVGVVISVLADIIAHWLKPKIFTK